MELRSEMDWCFEIQCRGLCSHRMYPNTNRDLKISRCPCGFDGSGSDASWGPQLSSVSVHSFFGGSGKLRKADISFDCCVVNVIPRYFHPLRYFTT